MNAVETRLATMHDWARLWAWRNDPVTRLAFVNQKPVGLAEHLGWLAQTLDPERPPVRRLCIVELGGQAIGTFRLDCQVRGAMDCSVTVAPAHRRLGHGKLLVGCLVDEAKRWHPNNRLVARVRLENLASLRAFAANGFLVKEVSSEEFVNLELAW